MGKGENADNQYFLLFPTMFSTLSKTDIIILATFYLSSANPLNLIQSKNLSFGKELKEQLFKVMRRSRYFSHGGRGEGGWGVVPIEKALVLLYMIL